MVVATFDLYLLAMPRFNYGCMAMANFATPPPRLPPLEFSLVIKMTLRSILYLNRN